MNDNEKNTCGCCQKGKKNEYGDVWFESLPCKLRGNFSHDRPQILKRNEMYFLIVENFTMIRIKSCPICGRNLEDGQEIL